MRYQRPSGVWSSKLLPEGLRRLSTRWATSVEVARAVVAVLGQIAQEIGIGTAGLQQLLGYPVHLLEAVVADDDVQIVVRVDQRARHVVERHMELGLLIRQILFGQLLLGDVGHHRDRATAGHPAAKMR